MQNKLLSFHLAPLFPSPELTCSLSGLFRVLIFPSFRITRPCKSRLAPCSVIWSRFSIMISPLLKMILILNDTAHCWENETSVAASHFECPCEFIKSTSFLVPTRICTTAPVWKNIQGQKYLMWCRMPYRGLCSASQFMTVSLPKYLLCARTLFFLLLFFVVVFLFDVSFRAFPQRRRHRVEKREEMLCCAGYYPHLTSHFKAYGTGLIPVSNQDARLKRYLLYFSKINWNGVFTSDTSRRSDVSPKPRVRQKTTGKWQASWWEFFAVTLPSSQRGEINK